MNEKQAGAIGHYGPVALLAGAVITLQIAIMRVFAVGSWSHFGSLVVSLAMLGFGLASVVIFLAGGWLDRHGRGAASLSLILFGPLAVGANLLAQTVPFNAIFLLSDPKQKWLLLDNFLLYLLPFLAGAFFLGIVFRQGRAHFNRLYFADLAGSGLAGAVIFGAMYVLAPSKLMVAPLALWGLAVVLWFGAMRERLAAAAGAVAVIAAYLAGPALTGIPAVAVSQYKGISYARNFPDAHRIYRSYSPFGDLQIYASSYMHFAPGLSDNAAFNIPELPRNTYVGMYVDGDGPNGIMRTIPKADASYFEYLPMYYPYVLKKDPKVFVAQFGGGISTMTALDAGASSVTVAESNPAVLRAFRAPSVRKASGDILGNPRVKVVPYSGRLFLQHTKQRYDVIDLSLASSVGLSHPGGLSVIEKYAYTEQAIASYIRALAPGGILSVTVWNKQEPPKSVIRFFRTMAAGARAAGGDPAKSFFVVQSYLSTATVLYKKGGFTAADITKLRRQTTDLSFDEIYSPGYVFDMASAKGLMAKYRNSIFGNGGGAAGANGGAIPAASGNNSGTATGSGTAALPKAGAPDPTGPGGAASTAGGSLPVAGAADPTGPGGAASATAQVSATAPAPSAASDAPPVLPSTLLSRAIWHAMMTGNGDSLASRYVFESRPLTNDRPYFAGYVRLSDLGKTLDRLGILQDDWGYLFLWATLAVAALAATPLIVLPVLFGGRRALAGRGRLAPIILYFGCLGLGYITIEVGLISWFGRALISPTISATTVISGMLVFSGLGSLVAERIVPRARLLLPIALAVIALVLWSMVLWLPAALDAIGAAPLGLRILATLLMVAPAAFLMGFPMATAMNWLSQRGRERSFVWAWGINGCFSVVGAVLVPLISVIFGLSAVLFLGAAVYLLAAPAFLAMAGRTQTEGAGAAAASA